MIVDSIYSITLHNDGKLKAGDKLIDKNGKVMNIICWRLELTDQPVKVYNFQVEDYHTYYVSEKTVLVHNADYEKKIIELEGKTEEIPIVEKPGSPSWKNAVKQLKAARKKGNNYVVKNQENAERLINEAQPKLKKVPAYTDKPLKANYQIHPINNEYNMPQIKFENWTNGKSGGFNGHIFWEE